MKFNYFLLVILILSGSNSALYSAAGPGNPGQRLVELLKDNQFGAELGQIVENLATNPGLVNFQDAAGSTALSYLAKNNSDTHSELAEHLIEQFNADPNLADREGFTPLMLAARGGNDKIIEVLLSKVKDLNINAQGRYGKTALDWAYDPRAGFEEDVNFDILPVKQRGIINFLKRHGAKSGKDLVQEKEEAAKK